MRWNLLLLLALFGVEGEEFGCDWRYKSNPFDCGSFLVCNFGSELVQRCPRGLHWNDAISTCDWKHAARCSAPEEDDNEIDKIIPPVIKESCSGGFKGNPSDCSSYYVCNHGEWEEMSCGASLHWNPTHNSCDWPASAGCGSAPVPAPIPGTSTAGPPAPPPGSGWEEEEGNNGPPAPPTTTSSSGDTDPTVVGIITGPPSGDDDGEAPGNGPEYSPEYGPEEEFVPEAPQDPEIEPRP